MNGAAVVLGVLMAVCAVVLFWLTVKVSQVEANDHNPAAEKRIRQGAEQSGLFSTYGEDDQ